MLNRVHGENSVHVMFAFGCQIFLVPLQPIHMKIWKFKFLLKNISSNIQLNVTIKIWNLRFFFFIGPYVIYPILHSQIDPNLLTENSFNRPCANCKAHRFISLIIDRLYNWLALVVQLCKFYVCFLHSLAHVIIVPTGADCVSNRYIHYL